jgi:hypothetical protein
MASQFTAARQVYLRTAFLVAKNSPAAWIDFIEALKLYVASELERSTTAPSAEAQVALGMNRRLLEMRDDFVNIEEKGGK